MCRRGRETATITIDVLLRLRIVTIYIHISGMDSEKSGYLVVDGEQCHVVLGWNIVWTPDKLLDGSTPSSMSELRKHNSRRGRSKLRNAFSKRKRGLQTLRISRESGCSCSEIGICIFEVEGERVGGLLKSERFKCKVQFIANSEHERDDWMRAIRSRTEMWSVLLKKSLSKSGAEQNRKFVEILTARPLLDSNNDESFDLGETLESAATKFTDAVGMLEEGVEWVQPVSKALGVASTVIESVGSSLPLIGAAVPVVNLLLGGAARVARLRVNDAKQNVIVAKSRAIAILMFKEMFNSLGPSEKTKEYFQALSSLLAKVEKHMRDFEEHLNGNAVVRFRYADLPSILASDLDDCEKEFVHLRVLGNVVLGREENRENFAQVLKAVGSRAEEELSPNFSTVPSVAVGTGLWLHDESQSEGKLLRMVLISRASHEGSEARSCGSLVIAVHGISGVGKTSALKVIGNHDGVQKLFPDGVYWLQLSSFATDLVLVAQIANTVAASGGRRVSEEIRSSNNLSSAVRIAKNWFHGHKVLIIVDDVWSVGGGTRFMRSIKEAAGQTGCVLFSTRDSSLVKSMSTVHCKFDVLNPRGRKALDILIRNTGWEEGSIGLAWQEDPDMHFVLDKCAGLPLSLAIAGRSAGKLGGRWDVYRKFYEGKSKLTSFQPDIPCYGGLAIVKEVAMKVLEQQDPSKQPTTENCIIN